MSKASLAQKLRRWLKQLLLRGAVLRWWAARRFRQADAIYLRELVRVSREPLPSLVPVRLKHGRPIANFTLIGDFLWEADELVPELQRFLEVQTCNLRPVLRDAPRDEDPAVTTVRAVREFLADSTLVEPDILMLYARPGLLSDEVFSVLRARWSCPIIGMNLDEKIESLPEQAFAENHGGYARWVPFFDINLTNALAVTDWYRARGQPVIYFPHGFKRPKEPPPAVCPRYEYELSFLGAQKSDRERVARELHEAGLPLKLFGRGWPGSGWIDDPVAIFRRSQINLGFGFATSALTNLKGRDFECTGAGGCYLTTYNWELAPFFENGKEILLYREVPELIEIFSYYRRRPEACATIAQAAYTRSLREHTWERRFRDLFQQLGLRAS